jgi:iron complex outermembrane receptor protein
LRADWERPGEQLTVQGNVYTARVGQPEPGSIAISGSDLALGTIEASGVNLTGRWEHLLDNGSTFSLQAYYDRTRRTIPPTLSETLDIVDLQFQHSLLPIGKHALTWGANYRHGRDRVGNTSSVFAFLPEHVNQNWSSLFAQDEVTLGDDLRLTLGARIERSPYTDNEVLPNARLAWKLAPDHLLWAAVSRAVRAPSRLDADAHVPRTPPFLLEGGPGVRSEVADVAELGYRGRPRHDLSYSVTAFHAEYDHLRTAEITPSGTSIVFANGMEGEVSGIEMWGTYQALPEWRLSAGYTAMRDRLRLKPGSVDVAAPNEVGKNPAHTWQLRSALSITENGDLDIAVRHVAALSSPDVPSFTAVDARFGWRLQPSLELSVAGLNLLDADHGEYADIATRSRIPRTVFVQLLWQR